MLEAVHLAYAWDVSLNFLAPHDMHETTDRLAFATPRMNSG